MPDGTVTQLRPLNPGAYTDTAAMNDIHAVLTSPAGPRDGALAGIAEILARSGRPVVAVRDIEVASTETTLGWPAARVDAGDTCAYVRQDPVTGGIHIEIRTRSAAETDSLTVSLDRYVLHPASRSVTHLPSRPDSAPSGSSRGVP
jgi:hypothetical protein